MLVTFGARLPANNNSSGLNDALRKVLSDSRKGEYGIPDPNYNVEAALRKQGVRFETENGLELTKVSKSHPSRDIYASKDGERALIKPATSDHKAVSKEDINSFLSEQKKPGSSFNIQA